MRRGDREGGLKALGRSEGLWIEDFWGADELGSHHRYTASSPSCIQDAGVDASLPAENLEPIHEEVVVLGVRQRTGRGLHRESGPAQPLDCSAEDIDQIIRKAAEIKAENTDDSGLSNGTYASMLAMVAAIQWRGMSQS